MTGSTAVDADEARHLMDHPVHAGLKIAAPPVQFDNQQAAIRRPAAGIGEHSAEVLAEIGYSPAEISERVAGETVIVAPSRSSPSPAPSLYSSIN